MKVGQKASGGTDLILSIFSENVHILEFFHAASLHFSEHDEPHGPDLLCSNPLLAKSEWDPLSPVVPVGSLVRTALVGTVAVTVAVATPSIIYGCWGSSWLGKQSPSLAQPFAGGKCALLSLME